MGDVTHPCTAAVTSTVMKVLPARAGTAVATTLPMAGAASPVTVTSDHDVATLTVSRSNEPAAPTRFRNSVRVAFCTWFASIPEGSVLRSNCTSPTLAEVPTATLVVAPKFVPFPGT
jgi:hypothetical protein